MQGDKLDASSRFIQPPHLVWLAMNALLGLVKPEAMAALLQHTWPGLMDALLQECGTPSQHMWMVMGCLRAVAQVAGAQVGQRTWGQIHE